MADWLADEILGTDETVNDYESGWQTYDNEKTADRAMRSPQASNCSNFPLVIYSDGGGKEE